jgi:hypothetical protein
VVHFPQLRHNGCVPIGIPKPSQRDMPMNQKPSRSKIRQICGTGFYIDALLYKDHSFETGVFETEKRVHDHMFRPNLPLHCLVLTMGRTLAEI